MAAVRCIDGAVVLLSDPELASYAIDILSDSVEVHWHTISDVLGNVESLAAMPDFTQREKAALLASKLYFHLDRVDNAISYAMAAGSHFDCNDNSDYTRTIMGAGVERYAKNRQNEFARIVSNFEAEEEDKCGEALTTFVYSANGNSRFEKLFEEMVIQSAAQQSVEVDREVCGVCIETRRFDLLKKIALTSVNQKCLLRYCLRVAKSAVRSRWLERQILQLVSDVYARYLPTRTADGKWQEKEATSELVKEEALPLATALAILKRSEPLAEFIAYLVERLGDEGELLAQQIAFDIQSLEDQKFSRNVMELLRGLLRAPPDPTGPGPVFPESESGADAASTAAAARPAADPSPARPSVEDGGSMSDEQAAPKDTDDAVGGNSSEEDTGALAEGGTTAPPASKTTWEKLRLIFLGEALLDLNVWYLHKHNRADIVAMEKIKCAVDVRSSLCLAAVAMSQALLLAGTTSDAFVRNNLDWLSRASCWTKFVVGASTGMLHRCHLTAARTVLAAYLPQAGATATNTGGPYAEGGGLLALGIVLANCPRSAERTYFCDMIRQAEQHCPTNYEPLQVGGCLGVSLMMMGSCNEDVTVTLRRVLFVDSAISGEAAAIGLGITHLGTLDPALALQLLEHARETEHDRVRRGAALGVALLAFQKEEQAEAVVESLLEDKLDALRLAGQWAVGMAFCGTGNAWAIRRLLKDGVGDLCPDVRRAAVLALGFVLAKRPPELSRIMSLLSDSFDPHVRYGAALALGLAGESVGDNRRNSAVETLLRLAEDTCDFVRQAALIGLGMALCHANPAAVPEAKDARDLFTAAITRKHEDALARFGAVIGSGLIDAGGKNGSFSLFNSNGSVRPESAVGFLMFFLQWHWHPYIIGIALALRPQALIGLDQDLQVPGDFLIGCKRAVAERTGYYEAPSVTVRETRVSAVAAVLTQKRRRRRRGDERPGGSAAAPTADSPLPEEVAASQPAPAEVSNSNTTEKPAAAAPAAPADGWVRFKNPVRVLPMQRAHLTLDLPDSAWVALDPERRSGVVLLRPKNTPITSGEEELGFNDEADGDANANHTEDHRHDAPSGEAGATATECALGSPSGSPVSQD